MTVKTPTQGLDKLATLREREVDRLTTEVASKQQLRERYVRNIDRMERLCEKPTGALSPVLSMNSAHYKQAVLQMVDIHRQDLVLHDADMAVSRQALHDAARRREVIGQVMQTQAERLRVAQGRQDQKRQDEMASLLWWRTQR